MPFEKYTWSSWPLSRCQALTFCSKNPPMIRVGVRPRRRPCWQPDLIVLFFLCPSPSSASLLHTSMSPFSRLMTICKKLLFLHFGQFRPMVLLLLNCIHLPTVAGNVKNCSAALKACPLGHTVPPAIVKVSLKNIPVTIPDCHYFVLRCRINATAVVM